MCNEPPEQHDVLDVERLLLFREKRAEWVAWLSGSDPHAIWNHLASLLWDAVLFRTINDLRREAHEQPTSGVGFNSTVIRLFDAGFATTQAAAIRRLTERQPRDPTKGVISLRRLIDEMRTTRELMTREVYLAINNLPYDPEPAKRAWLQQAVAEGTNSSGASLPTKGPEAWGMSENIHKHFDRLMRDTVGVRSRNDTISPYWYDWLDSMLDECGDVSVFTNKFVAHAAEPASRANLTPPQTGVTLDQLTKCHRVLYRVASFIYGPLLWEGHHSAVPVPQDDHLANLEKAWISKGRKGWAQSLWENNAAPLEAWASTSPWPDESTLET